MHTRKRWVSYLDGDAAPGAVIVHEDTQHMWDELRQVELELPTQRHHDLLNEEDDGVLHGVVWCPVLLHSNKQQLVLIQKHSCAAYLVL